MINEERERVKKAGRQFVEPIREKEKIYLMKQYLAEQSYRNYFIFVFGINTGLYLTDILALRVKDVRNKDYIKVDENGSGRIRTIVFSGGLKKEISKYTNHKNDEQLLFPSRKGDKPIGRQTIWRFINEAAKASGVIGNIGAHTMRKTYGFHMYERTKDAVSLQIEFGHKYPSDSLRYIGIDEKTINKVNRKLVAQI